MNQNPENKISISLKATYTPLGDVSIRVHNKEREFANYKGAVLHFTTDSNTITATKNIEITNEDLKYIQNDDPEKQVNEELSSLLMSIYKDVQNFLAYIQAFDGVFKLDPELRMKANYEWSSDMQQYQPLHIKFKTEWRGANLINTVSDNFMGELSRITKLDYPLFTAFKFLYQAYADSNTKFKWINATIAAEQAFKEFLSLFDERTENIMLNVPSPPIEKLYNNVLKSYTGFSSSMYKELQKGAQTRNALIHKHKTPAPPLEETNIYLHQVEVAIFELYTCLYPKDEFFAHLLDGAKHRLQHVIKGGSYFQ